MSIAPLLLAFLSVAGAPSNDSSSGAVLLNFHAQWCAPCHKARPAVEELIRDGYPVKRIDIDEEPDLPRRYRVEAVPAFVVVDRDGRELGRLSGPRSAGDLARFYKTCAAKARPPADASRPAASRGDRRSGDEEGDEDRDVDADQSPRRRVAARGVEDVERSEPAFSNPKPWETVVRIQVIGERTKGFGSGTVIYSTPEESLVLTCAHIFKLDGRKQTPPPSQFPRRIVIDLFDGRLEGTDPARVHYADSVEGKAVDYDFTLDVGLIRMRPGRQLPASRVVPASWNLQERMKVVAVGCPEGHDATVWHTRVRRPRILNFLSGNPNYEAIECDVAPKEGRSGGGLYTMDGYVVGVCNFAEPQGNHGLYATPRSIYRILDKNDLASLYAPIRGDSGTVLADRRAPGRPLRNGPGSVVRSQTPEADEPVRGRVARDEGDILVPAPSLMNISDPVTTRTQRKPVAASGTTRRASWQPTRDQSAKAENAGQSELPAHDRIDRGAADRTDAAEDTPAREREFSEEDAPIRSNQAASSKTRWREVKPAPPDQAPARAED